MAQRLEAALRRPGTGGPEPRQTAQPAPSAPAEYTNGEPPPTAPEEPGARPVESGAKSKSVLDSLEEEMASLLGRPPEKPDKQ
jgi:hypothetical protein